MREAGLAGLLDEDADRRLAARRRRHRLGASLGHEQPQATDVALRDPVGRVDAQGRLVVLAGLGQLTLLPEGLGEAVLGGAIRTHLKDLLVRLGRSDPVGATRSIDGLVGKLALQAAGGDGAADTGRVVGFGQGVEAHSFLGRGLWAARAAISPKASLRAHWHAPGALRRTSIVPLSLVATASYPTSATACPVMTSLEGVERQGVGDHGGARPSLAGRWHSPTRGSAIRLRSCASESMVKRQPASMAARMRCSSRSSRFCEPLISNRVADLRCHAVEGVPVEVEIGPLPDLAARRDGR